MQTYESRGDNPRYVTSIYTMSRTQCLLQLFHHLGYAEHNDLLWTLALWSVNLSAGTCESPRWHVPFAVTQLSLVSDDPRQQGVNIQHNARTLLFLCSGRDNRSSRAVPWLEEAALCDGVDISRHDGVDDIRQNHILFVIVISWSSPLLDTSHLCSIFVTIQSSGVSNPFRLPEYVWFGNIFPHSVHGLFFSRVDVYKNNCNDILFMRQHPHMPSSELGLAC